MKKLLTNLILFTFIFNFLSLNCYALKEINLENEKDKKISKYVKGELDNLSKKEIKELKKEAKNYYIKINDKHYKGIKKIKVNEIEPNSDIQIYKDPYNDYNLKRFKRKIEIEEKYNLNKKDKEWAQKATKHYRKNVKFLTKTLQNGTYADYIKYCHTTYVSKYEYQYFKKHYNATKKLIDAGNFTDEEIKRIACYDYIVQLDDKYYKNVNKIDLDTLKNAKTHAYHNPSHYGTTNPEKIKQYNIIKNENNLDDATMTNIWQDTKKLTRNVKLVKKALKDGTYSDYYNYSKYSDKYFKKRYELYLLTKDKEYLNEKTRKKIINNSGVPCLPLNPTYWGSPKAKVKNTINSKRIKDNDKADVIKKRLSYRRATSYEMGAEVGMRAIFVGFMLTGICAPWGLVFWCMCNEDSVFKFKI